MRYVVEVKEQPPETPPYRHGLMKAFDISEAAAAGLIAGLPGVVTRPVAPVLAREIARRFRAAGFEAVARSEHLSSALDEDAFDDIDFSDEGVFVTQEQMRETMLGLDDFV